jgi:hypothetical protein
LLWLDAVGYNKLLLIELKQFFYKYLVFKSSLEHQLEYVRKFDAIYRIRQLEIALKCLQPRSVCVLDAPRAGKSAGH